MKSKFAVLLIVLGMGAPMFARGVQVDFTMNFMGTGIPGGYRVTVTEGNSIQIFENENNVPWVLSICYDPDTPDSDPSSNRGMYSGAIQHWVGKK